MYLSIKEGSLFKLFVCLLGWDLQNHSTLFVLLL
jgi:hypothetical protein